MVMAWLTTWGQALAEEERSSSHGLHNNWVRRGVPLHGPQHHHMRNRAPLCGDHCNCQRRRAPPRWRYYLGTQDGKGTTPQPRAGRVWGGMGSVVTTASLSNHDHYCTNEARKSHTFYWVNLVGMRQLTGSPCEWRWSHCHINRIYT